MEYYQALNFSREPFSNSPDPGLFYESKQHLTALQQLEIAVRLKRGLNVIIGDVGTGKTTLSRQLIQKLSQDASIEYALILDPSFDTPEQFLAAILSFFGSDIPEDAGSARLKEALKQALFKQGMDRQQTLVLIIDEGQKLAPESLELLRELLNFETNSQKLLQIVIFAQKEFNAAIAPLDNFKDRINFQYELHPLNYAETKAMVKYRITATKDVSQTASPFLWSAYPALYRYTGGYPRKIINLCHHVLLALIVSNRSRAGYFFIRSCAARSGNPAKERIGLLPAGIAMLLLAVAIFFLAFQFIPTPAGIDQKTVISNPGTSSGSKKQVQAALSAVSISPDPGVQKAALQPKTAVPAMQASCYGTVEITKNNTLSQVVEQVYGSFRKEYLELILKQNPDLKDPDRLKIGMILELPSVDPFSGRWHSDAYCIVLSESINFKDAYGALQNFPGRGVDVRMLPFLDQGGSFHYRVVVNRTFQTLEAAKRYQARHRTIASAVCMRIRDLIQEQENLQRNPI